jgi:transposase
VAEQPGVDEQWRIADGLWERIEPHLPAESPHPQGGRPWMPARRAMDGIFYVLRTGCQWKALPRSLGAGSTVHKRFQTWREAGVFRRLWQEGVIAFDAKVGIDWTWQAMDGAMTKAPLGGEKNRRQSDGSGQERHQAVAADRRAWCTHWPGRRRRESTRHETDRGNLAIGGDSAS